MTGSAADLPAVVEVLPAWAALLTSLFVLTGAGLALIGCIGMLRFQSFYQRVHAPTLGTSLGTMFTLIASMIYFSVSGDRLVIHEILIAIFVTVTTPVTLVLLVRASRYRDLAEGTESAAGIGLPEDFLVRPDAPADDQASTGN